MPDISWKELQAVQAERDKAVQRYEDKRLEVHNVCKDRAAAEKKLASANAQVEAWIAKWKVQEDYRIRCATQAYQITRLRKALEWALTGDATDDHAFESAHAILAETAQP